MQYDVQCSLGFIAEGRERERILVRIDFSDCPKLKEWQQVQISGRRFAKMRQNIDCKLTCLDLRSRHCNDGRNKGEGKELKNGSGSERIGNLSNWFLD